MRFTVEVDDFWLDEEELEGALKLHITTSVVSKITKQIEDKVNTEIREKVSETINEVVAATIDKKIAEFIATGLITKRKSSYNSKGPTEDITVEEHLRSVFMDSSGWHSPDGKMKDLAGKFGKELKTRYDKIFATHIVMGLKEQGLLKDEVSQMLLEGVKK